MQHADLHSGSKLLRAELKAWEKAFAAAHDGRKASREEIKQDEGIAAKYKEYNKIREQLVGDDAVKTQEIKTPTKPRSKRPIGTPSKKPSPHVATTYEAIQSPEFGTPAVVRTFIGPTPQKDGVVLGLFDLLPEHNHATPSKPSTASRTMLADVDANAVFATPRKTPGSDAAPIEDELNQRHSRTPQSAGKRFLLDSFVTPSKRRRLSNDFFSTPSKPPSASTHTNHLATPRNTARDVHFSTPSFLRRDFHRRSTLDTLPLCVEETIDDSTIFARSSELKSPAAPAQWTAPGLRGRRGMARSLSTMIAEMRAQEEQRMDDEMDMLREAEEEEEQEEDSDCEGGALQSRTRRSSRPQVLVRDSQHVGADEDDEDDDDHGTPMRFEDDEQKLGPDGAESSGDDHDKEGLGPAGVPLRVWKKKGLKRQTKRVLMRPIVRPATRATPAAVGEHDVQVIAETQNQHSDDASDSDFYADADADASLAESAAKAAAAPPKQNKHASATTTNTIVKKIASTAHANFRRLKIRSSKGAAGGGGNGGFKGRFGRRR